jgi:uncharacterized membrane protein YvlD (DUF360 family)
MIIPGVDIEGGFSTLLLGSCVLTLLFLILKPILNILSFPVNLVTLGIFTAFVNALLLYLLTIFVTHISISAFTYMPTNIAGFGIPEIQFNTFFAYIYTALILSSMDGLIKWLMK